MRLSRAPGSDRFARGCRGTMALSTEWMRWPSPRRRTLYASAGSLMVSSSRRGCGGQQSDTASSPLPLTPPDEQTALPATRGV